MPLTRHFKQFNFSIILAFVSFFAIMVLVAADDVPAAIISRAPGEHYSRDSELLAIEEPQAYMKKERQISVDPKSLQEPCPDPYHGEASFNFMLKPVKTSTAQLHPPPMLPAKPKFLSCSLPNSAASSPRFSTSLFKRKSKNDSPASPRQVEKLDRQHQPHQGSSLWRSKSCGDGRSSAVYDEFVLPKVDTNVDQHDKGNSGSFTKAGLKAKDHPSDEEFKCGSLCLFLPGFGKGKPVRPRKEGGGGAAEVEDVVSRTVSMEKFECGSWASSAITNDYNEEDDGDSKNLYFDLPLELIRNNGMKNEASCPVSAAFVFDKERKGVLKNVNTKGTGGKSHESGRHVRFSVSSPSSVSSPGGSCMTPRLRKAREDFSAYLEAQSA